tara:strand:+ start:410 stop:598 length:189 start_codon:yes stop_codon:yes gene_type:complete
VPPANDKLNSKLDANKKMGLGAANSGDQKQDLGEHFQTEVFEKTVEDLKLLSEESSMRKINA